MTKILVVDDQPGIRQLLRVVLAHRGYDVLLADCGRKAMEILVQSRPRIAVLDLHIPDMGGLELVSQIRMRDPAVTIFILTGVDREFILERAQKLGVTDVFEKGESLHRLGHVIDQLTLI